MSDESQLPQLRLRPRKREDEPASAATPLPSPSEPLPPAPPFPLRAPVDATPAPVESPARFRLKPKLPADVAEKQPEPSEPAGLPSSVTDTPPPPVLATDDIPGLPRLKLKMVDSVVSAPAAPPSGVALPEIVPPAPVPMPAPPPVVLLPLPPNISGSQLVGGLPPVVVKPAGPLTSRPSSVMPPPMVVPPPARSKAGAKGLPKAGTQPASKLQPKKKWLLIIVPAVAVFLLGGATCIFLMRQTEPLPVVVRPAPKPAPKPAVTELPPDTPVGQPLTGSRIAPLPPQPLPPPSTSVIKGTRAAPSSTVLAAAFRTWIDNARITGVATGESPRAIINGRLVRPGDIVDATEGIVFDGLDAERKQVVFRSRSGLFAGKPY